MPGLRINPFAPPKGEGNPKYLDLFAKGIKKKGFTAAFAWESDNGAKYAYSQPCHAAMTYGTTANFGVEGNFDAKKIIRVFNGVPLRRFINDYDPMSVAFMEWAVYHSPYKSVFLSDDQAVLHDKHVTIGNPEKPANLMTAGLMLSRYIYEHPAVSETWFKLVEEGLHPDIAFLTAHRYYIDEHGILQSHSPSHTGCFTGVRLVKESYVLNFLQRKPQHLAEPYIKNTNMANSTFCLWDGDNKDAKGEASLFADALPKLLTNLAKPVEKTANVFSKAKPDVAAKKITFKDAAPALVEFFEPYKEYINA